jgi:hypothetical protein
MSGSRTRTGCYTCRLRKKKCDEQKPDCLNCRSREIVCYGYGAKPDWMHGMGSWKEIMESHEAALIRESAEMTYKARRRIGAIKKKRKEARGPRAEESSIRKQVDSPDNTATEIPAYNMEINSSQTVSLNKASPTDTTQEGNSANVVSQMLHLQHSGWTLTTPMLGLWWDKTLPATHLSLHSSMRLLMTFIDVIFPLQCGFSGLSETKSRNWLMHTLISTEPFYQASLSVAVSYYWGMTNGNQNEDPDLDLDARRLQITALRGLQQRVNELSSERHHGAELMRKGMQTLAIMMQLLSLEVFSFVGGQWDMHLQAARTILGQFQKRWAPELFLGNESSSDFSKMGVRLMGQCSTDDLKAFEFFITSFVWVDVIANASHGSPPFQPGDFDSLPLLRNGYLKPQTVMGCQSCILVVIAEITTLESWKNAQIAQGCLSMIDLISRAAVLNNRLALGIQGLEDKLSLGLHSLRDDSDAVNLVFAYAALVYLHTVVSGTSPHISEIKYNVTRCLERFEVLPARLLIRYCWPFTITGCMATEDQYDRFRHLVARSTAADEPLGSTWKGLKVMEECWQLRKSEPGMWCWRSTMQKMNMKVLLI